MSAPVAVSKMHGARNDFVVVDVRSNRIPSLPEFAVGVCDRTAGIGADGLIAIGPSEGADASMRIFNADGSEAEMCGNGIRCAARFLDEAGEGDRAVFETRAGRVRTTVVSRGPEYVVRVELPAPDISSEPLGELEPAVVVDTGNPHVVVFRDSAEEIELAMFADALQRHPRFEHGTNVHVAAVRENSLHVRHWERGAGMTMACGTGAVACAAAAIARGLVASPVDVFVPGGRLTVEWDRRGPAYLTGPAVRVFNTVLTPEPALIG